MFQLDLSPSGNLQLHLPTGRALEIEPTIAGLTYVLKVLSDDKRKLRGQKGYVKNFPTQHNIEQWMEENRKQEAEKKANGLGIDLTKLEINL